MVLLFSWQNLALASLLFLSASSRRTLRFHEEGLDKQAKHDETAELVDKFTVRSITKQELAEHYLRGVSLTEAQNILNSKISEALADAQVSTKGGAKKNATVPGTQPSPSSFLEDVVHANIADPRNGNSDELQKNLGMSNDAFQKEMFDQVIAGAVPAVTASICLNIDLDLHYIMPGLKMEIGISGSFYRDRKTGCWGATLDAGFGWDYGFDLWGHSWQVGVQALGTLDLSEVPPSTPQKDLNSFQKSDPVYAPDGADLNVCHTRLPWKLIDTFIAQEYTRVFSPENGTSALEKMMQEPKYQQSYQELKNSYEPMLEGSFVGAARKKDDNVLPRLVGLSKPLFDLVHSDVRQGSEAADTSGPGSGEEEKFIESQWSHAFQEPMLTSAAVAMTSTMRHFVTRLPSYANQVLSRLCDDNGFGESAGSFALWSHARFRKSTGKYLARWPSRQLMLQYEENSGGTVQETNKARASRTADTAIFKSCKKTGCDDRVINLAKVMRLSEHRQELRFWKELGISAGNLLVRAIGDISALFSTAFGGTPQWDGACDSLPNAVNGPATIFAPFMLEVMQKQRWAAPRVSDRTGFNTILDSKWYQALHGIPFVSLRQGGPDADRPGHREQQDNIAEAKKDVFGIMDSSLDSGSGDLEVIPVLYPQLWCTMASSAPRERGGDFGRFRNARDSYEVSLWQTCDTTMVEERPIVEDDVIEWSEAEQRYLVMQQGDVRQGFLRDDAGPKPVCFTCIKFPGFSQKAAREDVKTKGFQVARKLVTARADCEQVQLPVSFVRLFPRFMFLVDQHITRMEELLLDINMCIGESHNKDLFEDFVAAHLKKQHGITDSLNHAYLPECKKRTNRLSQVTMYVKQAVQLLRIFLFRLGASDPRKNKKYQKGELPLSEVELRAIKDNFDENDVPTATFAPAANLMGKDFFEAFGIGVIGMTPQDREKWSASPHLHRTALFGTVDELQLEGELWQYLRALKPNILEAADPLKRLQKNKPRKGIHPPMTIKRAWTYTVALDRNNFCTPITSLWMISYVTQVTWQTWTNYEATAMCYIGQLKPGRVFIQIFRCHTADAVNQSEWRVRFQADILDVDLKHMKVGGMLGDLSKAPDFALSSLEAAGTVPVVAALPEVTENVMKSPWSSLFITTMLGGGPLLEVYGGGLGLASFKQVCSKFADYLGSKNVIHKINPKKGATNLDSDWSPVEKEWGAAMKWRLRGTLVFREQPLRLTHGPNAMANAKTSVVRHQRFGRLALVNQNMIGLPMPGWLGLIPFKTYIKGEIDVVNDLTPWIEHILDRKSFEENKHRIDHCARCLRDGHGFCDWRPV